VDVEAPYLADLGLFCHFFYVLYLANNDTRGKTMKLKTFLFIIAFVSLISCGILAHIDYSGKIYEISMIRHLRWPTWACLGVGLVFSWFVMEKK